MAEEALDKIVGYLGETADACKTAEVALVPEQDVANLSGILPPEISRAVVEKICQEEWAVHLDDVMIRRTSWHYYHADRQSVAKNVADWMSEFLSWSEEEKTTEIRRYSELIEKKAPLASPHFEYAGSGKEARPPMEI